LATKYEANSLLFISVIGSSSGISVNEDMMCLSFALGSGDEGIWV
jgi:hypothetical protein